jgi:hypothetical protein
MPKKWRKLDPKTDNTTRNLLDLAGDIDEEELEEAAEQEDPQDETDEQPCHDNDEGWIDEWYDMTDEDIDELEDSVRPIRFLLTKVNKQKQELYSIS